MVDDFLNKYGYLPDCLNGIQEPVSVGTRDDFPVVLWTIEGNKTNFIYLTCNTEDEAKEAVDIANKTNGYINLPFTKDDIITATKLPAWKIRNIYVFGSRIYKTHNEDSDYDILVLASNSLEHVEIKEKIGNTLLNIHIITHDKFQRDLDLYDMKCVESLFLPNWAKLQEKQQLRWELNIKKLIKFFISHSYNSWQGGKHKLSDGDAYKGLKSIYHSLRILMFGIQIAQHGKIINFEEANYLYDEIVNCDEIKWSYYKNKYLPMKVKLENKLKSYDR